MQIVSVRCRSAVPQGEHYARWGTRIVDDGLRREAKRLSDLLIRPIERRNARSRSAGKVEARRERRKCGARVSAKNRSPPPPSTLTRDPDANKETFGRSITTTSMSATS
jgi:hypothetical protein